MGAAVTKHYYYYDLLNIAASFAVVVLHCNDSVHYFSPGKTWIISLLIEVLFFWAVPIFFMLTGAKTLNYRNRHSTKEFLIGRLTRIFIPFVIWSVILYVLRFGVWGNGISSLSLSQFITVFMNKDIEPTYWFFFVMFGITLSIPVLSLLISNARIIKYMILCSFIFNSFIPYVFHFIGVAWNQEITISVVSCYVMYVLLGYLLSVEDFNVRQNSFRLISALAITSLIIRFIYTLVNSYAAGKLDYTLSDYGAFTTIFPCIWVFLFFQRRENVFSSLSKLSLSHISLLSNCAFGVYLVHKLVLNNFVCGFMNCSVFNPYFRFWAPLLVYGLSFILVFILKKIPFINHIVP